VKKEKKEKKADKPKPKGKQKAPEVKFAPEVQKYWDETVLPFRKCLGKVSLAFCQLWTTASKAKTVEEVRSVLPAIITSHAVAWATLAEAFAKAALATATPAPAAAVVPAPPTIATATVTPSKSVA